MTKRFAVLLVFALLCCHAACIAETPTKTPPFAVTGSWIASATNTDKCGWQQSGSELRFLIDPSIRHVVYEITRTEPLPDGDWTIDMWIQSVSMHPDMYIFIDDTSNHRYPATTLRDSTNPGLPLEWVRIACSPAKGRYIVMVNGVPSMKIMSDGGVAPKGKVSLLLGGENWDRSKSEALRILSFTVTAGADVETSVPGPAFLGWSTPINAKALKSIPNLDAKMESLFRSAATDTGKSYALAAKILAEYGAHGGVSPNTWSELSALVNELLPRDRTGLTIVLPIAVACANQAQKEQANAWVVEFFDVKYTSDWRQFKVNSDIVEKAILLDPVQATRMGYPVSGRILGYWTQSLNRVAPQYSLLPLATFLNNDNWKIQTVAWMLPDLCAASPILGKGAIDAVRAFKDYPHPQPGDPDLTMSFAAYRLAKVNPVASAEFLALIKDPETKVDTISYSVSGALTASQATEIEGLLKQSIAQFKPSLTHSTPIDQMLRLVKFFDTHKQPEKAASVLAEAVARIEGSKGDMYRELIEIARYKRQIHSSDSQIWWDRAVAAAQAVDAERGMPDNSGGLYVSGLISMVRDLAEEGHFDEAVAIVKKMDTELMKNNRAMALDPIIVRMLKTDTKGAIALLKEYPEMRAKYGITGVIAAKVAQTDLSEGLAMLKGIPEPSRATALLRLAEVVPQGKLGPVLDELKKSIAAGAKPSGAFRLGFGSDNTDRYAKLPLDTMLSLSDSFNESPGAYAVYLLACVVQNCGLANDPLWIQYWGINRTKGNGAMIPWSAGKLRYAVDAE